jgi:hypothetical protein
LAIFTRALVASVSFANLSKTAFAQHFLYVKMVQFELAWRVGPSALVGTSLLLFVTSFPVQTANCLGPEQILEIDEWDELPPFLPFVLP